jgi:N-acyl-D-amino-acid deacylase
LLIPGSSTLLVRRWDGLNWAVLFNSDHGTRGTHLADAIDPLVHQAADSVRSWPAVELLPTVPR